MKNRWHRACALLALLGCALTVAAQSRQDAPVQLIFAGDTTLDGAPGQAIRRGKDPFQSFAPLFAAADVRLVNLECVVSTRGHAAAKYYTFRAHPRVLSVLQRHVDGVTLANNHSGDYGHAAFVDMLDLLQRHGLRQVGGGRDLSEAHTPWMVERKGLRIALLSYNEFMPRSYEAGSHSPGVAWSEDAQVIDDIRRARQEHRADLVLPFMHWGWENEPRANARQRALARRMIDAGADAVIGGHPHVTQDIEVYRGKPIIYSVGNFVMQATDNEQQREGWVLRLQLQRHGVSAFDTHVARIDHQGLPRLDRHSASPCWSSAWDQTRLCTPSQTPLLPTAR